MPYTYMPITFFMWDRSFRSFRLFILCLHGVFQAVYRMAKTKLSLRELINEEEEVASIVRSVGALPLLPAEDIKAGLTDLAEEAVETGWMHELKPFFKYMAKEWLPKVPILSVIDSEHRTNNASESSNRSLNKELKSNPSCFQVVGKFYRVLFTITFF